MLRKGAETVRGVDSGCAAGDIRRMITLTERAASALRRLGEERGAGERSLRVFIESGGCSGLEYAMSFDEPREGDEACESHGVRFFVDAKSLERLSGSEIDFDDGLSGKGFEIRNPNAKTTCGCGRSFN